MNVGIYARVSTDDKEQNPERQIMACEQYAELHGHKVLSCFEEYISGDSNPFMRPEFKRLIELKPQGILFFEISRFSREHPSKVMRRLQELKDSGVKVISITEPAFNMEGDFSDLLQYIMSWFNNYYLTNLRRNVKSGLERARKKGKILGRPKAKFNEFRAYHLLFIENKSLDEVAREVGSSKATLYRFKKVAEKNPGSYIKEVGSSKTGVFETKENKDVI